MTPRFVSFQRRGEVRGLVQINPDYVCYVFQEGYQDERDAMCSIRLVDGSRIVVSGTVGKIVEALQQ